MKRIFKKNQSQKSLASVTTQSGDSDIKIKEIEIVGKSRECIIVLSIFLTTFVILGIFVGYSLYVNLQRANQKLQKIELRFHKFLFYLKYIYDNQKHEQQLNASQNNSIMDLLTKFTNSIQPKKQQPSTDSTLKRKKSTKEEGNPQSHNQNDEEKSTKNDIELMSDKEMIDIARKIIEQEHHEESLSEQNIYQDNQAQQNEKIQVIPNERPTNNSKIAYSATNHFVCHIDEENSFSPNFDYDPMTQKLQKKIFTSNFQSVFCQQPIPSQGTWQLSIKILQTTKSFIYVGISGGNKTQTHNITSLHQNPNFFGYSGFSGRIWQATRRKPGYEMFQANTIIKMRINMETKVLEYFFNGVKIGESSVGGLCEEECRFLVEMYNDGDQLQFLNEEVETMGVPDQLSGNQL